MSNVGDTLIFFRKCSQILEMLNFYLHIRNQYGEFIKIQYGEFIKMRTNKPMFDKMKEPYVWYNNF